MTYKHTQTSYMILFIIMILIGYFSYILISINFDPRQAMVMFLIVFILISFTSLTLAIDNEAIQLKYGFGMIRKRFVLKNIESVKTAINPWYYGWGIHYLPIVKIWVFNITGRNTVEIVMKNGKKFRLGTDEPKALEQAIRNAIR